MFLDNFVFHILVVVVAVPPFVFQPPIRPDHVHVLQSSPKYRLSMVQHGCQKRVCSFACSATPQSSLVRGVALVASGSDVSLPFTIPSTFCQSQRPTRFYPPKHYNSYQAADLLGPATSFSSTCPLDPITTQAPLRGHPLLNTPSPMAQSRQSISFTQKLSLLLLL